MLTQRPTPLAKFSTIHSFFLGDDGKENRALFNALPIDWVERNGVAAGWLVFAVSNFFSLGISLAVGVPLSVVPLTELDSFGC